MTLVTVGDQKRLVKEDLIQLLLLPDSGTGDPRSCFLLLTPEEVGTTAVIWSHLPLLACKFLAAKELLGSPGRVPSRPRFRSGRAAVVYVSCSARPSSVCLLQELMQDGLCDLF